MRESSATDPRAWTAGAGASGVGDERYPGLRFLPPVPPWEAPLEPPPGSAWLADFSDRPSHVAAGHDSGVLPQEVAARPSEHRTTLREWGVGRLSNAQAGPAATSEALEARRLSDAIALTASDLVALLMPLARQPDVEPVAGPLYIVESPSLSQLPFGQGWSIGQSEGMAALLGTLQKMKCILVCFGSECGGGWGCNCGSCPQDSSGNDSKCVNGKCCKKFACCSGCPQGKSLTTLQVEHGVTWGCDKAAKRCICVNNDPAKHDTDNCAAQDGCACPGGSFCKQYCWTKTDDKAWYKFGECSNAGYESLVKEIPWFAKKGMSFSVKKVGACEPGYVGKPGA